MGHAILVTRGSEPAGQAVALVSGVWGDSYMGGRAAGGRGRRDRRRAAAAGLSERHGSSPGWVRGGGARAPQEAGGPHVVPGAGARPRDRHGRPGAVPVRLLQSEGQGGQGGAQAVAGGPGERTVFPVIMRSLAVVSALLSGPLAAQTGVQYQVDSLPNGLRVILSEDHSTPVVSVDVWYHVGSRNEQAGRSGFAHLFEHMMFQGSRHVGKGQHFQLVERAGGDLNGTTNEDHTAYYQELPSNRLNLALWLEADRMRSLAITEENFENQRQAVKEERRLRVDNQPDAPALSEGITLLYDSTTCFAYAHSVIGSMADLDAAKVSDVQAFFDLHYAANNATLTVVGDFDPAEARQLIRQYFGALARGGEPAPLSCGQQFG